MPPPRYRRCPQCKAVSQASAFRREPGQRAIPGRMERRICPQCGHTDLLMRFPIVARPQPGQGEAL